MELLPNLISLDPLDNTGIQFGRQVAGKLQPRLCEQCGVFLRCALRAAREQEIHEIPPFIEGFRIIRRYHPIDDQHFAVVGQDPSDITEDGDGLVIIPVMNDVAQQVQIGGPQGWP